jgi:hypothetical protein
MTESSLSSLPAGNADDLVNVCVAALIAATVLPAAARSGDLTNTVTRYPRSTAWLVTWSLVPPVAPMICKRMTRLLQGRSTLLSEVKTGDDESL